MQAAIWIVLAGLQAVAPSDTLLDRAVLSPDSVFQREVLVAPLPARTSRPHMASPPTTRDRATRWERLASETGLPARTLKMLHSHPEEPTWVARVTITPPVRRRLASLYRFSEASGQEQVLCLGGRVEGARVHVTELRRPTVHRSDYLSVEYDGLDCLAPGFSFVGVLHTHPELLEGIPQCGHSRADQWTLAHLQRAVVSVVLCSPDLMAFMAHGQLSSPMLKLDNQVVRPTLPDTSLASLLAF